MASLSGFYTLVSEQHGESGTELTVSIHANHRVYEGHFPSQPVAPGAALTQMVIDEAVRLQDNRVRFAGARQIKFLKVLDPNVTATIQLHYTFAERDGQQQFVCVGKEGESVFFKIHGSFR